MNAGQGHDRLAALILDLPGQIEGAPIGFRPGGALGFDLDLGVERVARTHRLEPAQLVEAGRTDRGVLSIEPINSRRLRKNVRRSSKASRPAMAPKTQQARRPATRSQSLASLSSSNRLRGVSLSSQF